MSTPVLLLGSPGSGVGHVGDVLARGAGLDPEEQDLVRAAVDRVHGGLLRRLDRDWTCPPPVLDRDDVHEPDRAAVAAAITAATPNGAWFVADPLLLFTFSVWAPALTAVRLVAVVDDHADVIRWLVEQRSLEPGVADGVARCYLRRLRGLCERFDVPVVDRAAEPLLDGIGRVAAAHGLDWDAASAADLAATWQQGQAPGAADWEPPEVAQLELEAIRSRPPVPDASPVDAGALRAAIEDLAGHPDDELARAYGPRAVGRRARAWAAVGRPGEGERALELVTTSRGVGGADVAPPGAQTAPCRTLGELHQSLRAAGPVDILVLPDLLSWLESDDLTTALRLVVDHLRLDGRLSLSWSPADVDSRARTGRQALSVVAVEQALEDVGLLVTDRQQDHGQVVLRCVARPTMTALLHAAVERGSVLPVRQPTLGVDRA